jgi:acyl-[acyl carrier protein]--UDP-N-acetylglucosamine O-acyltransferase
MSPVHQFCTVGQHCMIGRRLSRHSGRAALYPRL